MIPFSWLFLMAFATSLVNLVGTGHGTGSLSWLSCVTMIGVLLDGDSFTSLLTFWHPLLSAHGGCHFAGGSSVASSKKRFSCWWGTGVNSLCACEANVLQEHLQSCHRDHYSTHVHHQSSHVGFESLQIYASCCIQWCEMTTVYVLYTI